MIHLNVLIAMSKLEQLCHKEANEFLSLSFSTITEENADIQSLTAPEREPNAKT